MMQIPLIFRQPGRIPAGKTADQLVSNYDFLPSVLGHLGLGERMPQQPRSPGRDFSRVLRGESIKWENAVFYEMETCRAIRTQQWKLVLRHPDGPHELYDMQADPRERFNLYGQSGTARTRDELTQRLTAFFQQYADPQYDVWTGGRSKARRLTGG
jgi:arylsulfatase A-like enzyme